MQPVQRAYGAATIGSLLVFGGVLSTFRVFSEHQLLFIGLVSVIWVSFLLIFVITFTLTAPQQEEPTR